MGAEGGCGGVNFFVQGPKNLFYDCIGSVFFVKSPYTACGQKIFGPGEGGTSDQTWPELIVHPRLFIYAPIFNPFGILG